MLAVDVAIADRVIVQRLLRLHDYNPFTGADSCFIYNTHPSLIPNHCQHPSLHDCRPKPQPSMLFMLPKPPTNSSSHAILAQLVLLPCLIPFMATLKSENNSPLPPSPSATTAASSNIYVLWPLVCSHGPSEIHHDRAFWSHSIDMFLKSGYLSGPMAYDWTQTVNLKWMAEQLRVGHIKPTTSKHNTLIFVVESIKFIKYSIRTGKTSCSGDVIVQQLRW